MPTSRALAKQIVEAYAAALYEAVASEDAVDAVAKEFDQVLSTVRGHVDLRDALLEATVPAENRAAIVREVFATLHPALVAVIALLAERAEFDLAGSVREAFTRVAENRRNMVAVEVTTVVELTDALRDSIKRKLSADMGRNVVLQEKIDASIIGGIVISAHGKRLDASIASQLESARMTLSTAHTGGEA
jgi:F-type H+-transporting ATPase subunit delta